MRPHPLAHRLAGLIEAEHNDCFYVEASLQDGTYMLLVAAVLLNVAQQLLSRAARAAIEDRQMWPLAGAVLSGVLCRALPLQNGLTLTDCRLSKNANE